MRKILLIIFGIFLINLVSSIPICIDHDPPSPPSNLILIKSVGNIIINWEPATDTPNCSGISHYDIYKNSAFLISVNETNYLDLGLSNGTYIYTVYAFDLAGHNEEFGISKTITLGGDEGSNDGGAGRGSGSGSNNNLLISDSNDFNEFVELNTEKNTNTGLLGIDDLNIIEENKDKNFLSGITGAVIGFGKSGTGIGLIIAIGILVIGIIIISFNKRHTIVHVAK